MFAGPESDNDAVAAVHVVVSWLSQLLVIVSIVVGRSIIVRRDGDDAVAAVRVTGSWVGDVLVVMAVGWR